MSTNTSKGLVKPTVGEFQDISVINGNSDRLNTFGMGAVVCTSTTRPSGTDRWDGQIAYETDTHNLMVFSNDLNNWLPANNGGIYATGNLAGNLSIPNVAITVVGVGTSPALTVEALGITYSNVDGSFTLPLDGVYDLDFTLNYLMNGTGSREAWMSSVSSAGARHLDIRASGSSASDTVLVGHRRKRFTANTKLFLSTYHNAGASLTLQGVTGTIDLTHMAISFVRP